jgi:hypothetical protein
MTRSIESRWKWPGFLWRRFHRREYGLPAAYSRVVADPAVRVDTLWEGALPAESSHSERTLRARRHGIGAESFSPGESGTTGAHALELLRHGGATPVAVRVPGVRAALPRGVALGGPSGLQPDVPATTQSEVTGLAAAGTIPQSRTALPRWRAEARAAPPLTEFSAFPASSVVPDLIRSTSATSPAPVGGNDAHGGAPDAVTLVRSPARLATLLRASLDTTRVMEPAERGHAEAAAVTPVPVEATAASASSPEEAPALIAAASEAPVNTDCVENVLEELQRRLELEFLRAYGTSGR